MTREEAHTEWCYRYAERLGILCGPMPPTQGQKELAAKEADEAVEKLNGEL